MVAKIEWGPLERMKNARDEKVIARNFMISSHDGWVSGQILVQDTADAAAIAECESRLSLLLKDAIKALGGNPDAPT
jgi:hypothetical protein